MTAFILKRIVQAMFVVLVMSVIVFLGTYAIGNPVDILVHPAADAEERALAAEAFGLDKTLWQQYFTFLSNIARGDLGTSFVFNRSAIDLILTRFPATLELALVALAIAIGVGIPLGVWSGLRPNTVSAQSIMTLSIFGFSLPGFWVGLMLIVLFSVTLGWLPSSGRGDLSEIPILGITTSLATIDGWQHILMPAINLSTYKMALVLRVTQNAVRENLQSEYVKFARARGLSERRILWIHVMKNVSLPLVTVIGLEFSSMLALTVVTETVFAWPGMGKLLIDSITVLDRPVVMAYLTMTVLIFVFINLIVDILYSILDPRVAISSGRMK